MTQEVWSFELQAGNCEQESRQEADGSGDDMRSLEFFGYGPEIVSRSQDREADDSGDDTISPEFFRYGLEIISRSRDKQSDESTDDTRSPEFFGAS